MPARGRAKLQALADARIDLLVAHACPDSLSDLSLLLAARTAHVVYPKVRDLVRLRRALGDRAEVLRGAGR